jgi:hypothetical protein
MIPAIIGGGLMVGGLLGKALSGKNKMRWGDFNPDPEGLAMEQFRQYNDLGSDFYKMGESAIRRTVADSQPTVDTLLGTSQAHGGGYGGSQSIANAQRQAHVNRAMDYGTTSLVDYYMKGQGLAQNALSMHFGNKQSQIGGYMGYKMQREADTNDLWGQFMTGGAGLLGMWAGNQMTPQPGGRSTVSSSAPFGFNQKKYGQYQNPVNILPKQWYGGYR